MDKNSVVDLDSGSGALLTDPDPGSGIGFFRIPDPKHLFLICKTVKKIYTFSP
jgi:hypothetical protein